MPYKSKRQLPPCPDPELYQMIKTEDGYFWRRKRGTVTKATLNKSFAEQAKAVKITAPAASHIIALLEPYTRRFQMGRITMRLSAQLRKGLKLGKLTYTCLQDFEFQKDYPLFKILMTQYAIEEKKEALQITIPLNQAVIKQNNLATDFWFDAILVYGDATKSNGLKSVDASSPPYAFNQKKQTTCVLTLPLPKHKTPWLLLLKVGCIEGNEMGLHAKHYAMKVIRVKE